MNDFWRSVLKQRGFTVILVLLCAAVVLACVGNILDVLARRSERATSAPVRVVPARERHKAEREAERMREGIERIADEMERARVQRLLEGR